AGPPRVAERAHPRRSAEPDPDLLLSGGPGVLLFKLRRGASAADVRHPRAALLLEEAAGVGIPEGAIGTIARNGSVEAAAVEHLVMRELVNRGYLELCVETDGGERIASLRPTATGAAFELGPAPARDRA